MSLAELTEKFDLSRVSTSPAAFDEDKLDWVNAHHLRDEPLADVAALAMRFAEERGFFEPDFGRFEAMVDLAREGLSRLCDLPDAISFFFDDHLETEDDAREWLSQDYAKQLASSLVRRLEEGGEEMDAELFKTALKSVGKDAGVKGKELFMPVRSALTGRTHGPALGEVAAVLGRERVIERLKLAAGEQGRS
jgi:nondiscriminating glutamyl-tRNA synthetase